MKFKARLKIERTVEIDNLEGEHAAEAKASITDEQIGLKNYERIIGCTILPIREPQPESKPDVKIPDATTKRQ